MHRAPQALPRVTNRLRAVLLHVPYFTIEGYARLARECGVVRSTISRLVRGKSLPTYDFARRITQVLSQYWGKPLDMRELFTTDGTYPTASVCDLMDCKGCFPPEAWNESTDTLRPKWRYLKPGEWSYTKPEEWSRLQADPSSPGHTI